MSIFTWQKGAALAQALGYATPRSLYQAHRRGAAPWVEHSAKGWRVSPRTQVTHPDPGAIGWTTAQHLCDALHMSAGNLAARVNRDQLEARGIERRAVREDELVVPREKSAPQKWLWRRKPLGTVVEIRRADLISDWARVGIVGIAMSLQRVGELQFSRHSIGRDRIFLDLVDAEQGLKELLERSFALEDGVLDPPAWQRQGHKMRASARMVLGQRLLQIFWRHAKSRTIRTEGDWVRLEDLATRHQATKIAKALASRRAPWCLAAEWVLPGTQRRHPKYTQTDWHVSPQEYLCALYAPLACPTRQAWPGDRPIESAALLPEFPRGSSLEEDAGWLWPRVTRVVSAAKGRGIEPEDFGTLRGKVQVFRDASWRKWGATRTLVRDVPEPCPERDPHEWMSLQEMAQHLGFARAAQLLTAVTRHGWDWLEQRGSQIRVHPDRRLTILGWSTSGEPTTVWWVANKLGLTHTRSSRKEQVKRLVAAYYQDDSLFRAFGVSIRAREPGEVMYHAGKRVVLEDQRWVAQWKIGADVQRYLAQRSAPEEERSVS